MGSVQDFQLHSAKILARISVSLTLRLFKSYVALCQITCPT